MRLLACSLLLVMLGGSVRAQTVDAPKAFLIADVHRSAPETFPFMHGGSVQGNRYFLRQATMADLVATAYGVDGKNVQGGPSWLERDRYDINAKVPLKTTPAQAKLMLRGLLAERFNLVVKNGTAPMPTYVLSAGPGKPKMTESDGTGNTGCEPTPPPQNQPPGTPQYIAVACRALTMEALAETLHNFAGGYLDQPVVDATGLAGTWDFSFKWTGRGQLEKQGADGISIFAAMEKQLGLKLELKTSPRPVFTVESVEREPTANPPGIAEALPAPPVPVFEVATIKPSKPDEQGFGRITAAQIDVRATPLQFLVMFAWNLNPQDKEVLVGAPKWLNETKFDILAKAGPDVRVDASPGGALINYEDLRLMLRALFAERFGMKAHMETRPITAYTLMAANPKLKPAADANARTRCKEGPGPDGKDPRTASPVLNRLVSCQNMTVAQIGEELQQVANGYIYSAVTDSTGLKGTYDFTLSFSSADKMLPATAGAAAADPNGAVSVFDAVSKQLGLKLEKEKRPSQVLVIDHIDETPTDN